MQCCRHSCSNCGIRSEERRKPCIGAVPASPSHGWPYGGENIPGK